MQANVNSTASGQRLGAGCIALFMLPFFAGGALALIAGVRSLIAKGPSVEAFMPVIFGVVFLLISIGVTATVIFGMRKVAETATLRSQHPDQPWLWRRDWSEGAILSQSGAMSLGIAFFALLWNAISAPAAYMVFSRGDYQKNPVVFVVLLFPFIGVCLLIAAGYQLLRAKKYGQSRVMLPHVPIPLGTTCHGEIVTRVKERPENGFNVRLQCLRLYITGSGKSRQTNQTELWRDDRVVASAASIPTVDGMRVPFSFDVPSDAEPADDREPSNRIVWRLSVGAETPGVDYAAQFELPVFHTPESERHEVRRFAPNMSEVTAWNPSAESRIVIQNNGEIYIGTHARFRDAFAIFFFSAIWWGAIALMLHFHAPIVFPIIFGFFGAVIALAMIDSTVGRTTLRADPSGLVVTRKWLGIGRPVTIGAAHIKSIVANPTPNSNFYQVDVINLGGRKSQVASYIYERRDAEMLAARLQRAVSG